MAVSKKSGKDSSGEYVFINNKGKRVKANAKNGIFEAQENFKLNDDLDEIAEEFKIFAKKRKSFEWWI